MGYMLSSEKQARLMSERRTRSRKRRLLQVRQQNATIAAEKVREFRARVEAGQKKVAQQLEAQWKVEHQQQIMALEAELAAALDDVGRSQKQAQQEVEEKANRAQATAQRAAENLQHAQARFLGALEEEQTRREMLQADRRAAKARRKALENTMQVERALAKIAAQNAELRQRAEEAAKAAREPVVLPVIDDIDAFRYTCLHRQLLERTPLTNIPGAENAAPQQVVRCSSSDVHIKGLDDSRVAAEIERRRKEAGKEKRERQREEMQSRTDEREAAAHFRIGVWKPRVEAAAAWAHARRAAALEQQAADLATPKQSLQALGEESTKVQGAIRESEQVAALKQDAQVEADKPAEPSARAEPSETSQPHASLAFPTPEKETDGAGAGVASPPETEAVAAVREGPALVEAHTSGESGLQLSIEKRDAETLSKLSATIVERAPTGRLPRIGEESPFDERARGNEGARTRGEAESPSLPIRPTEDAAELREAIESPAGLEGKALPRIAEEGPSTEMREALEELVAMQSESEISASARGGDAALKTANMGHAELEGRSREGLSELLGDLGEAQEHQEAENPEGRPIVSGEELRQSLEDFIAMERDLYEQVQRDERLRERIRTANGRRERLDVISQSQQKVVEERKDGGPAQQTVSESRPLGGSTSEPLRAGRRVLEVSTARSAFDLDYASSDFTLLSSPLSGLSPYSLLTSPLSDFSEDDLDGLLEKHLSSGHVAGTEPSIGQQGGTSDTAGTLLLTTSSSQVTTVTASISGAGAELRDQEGATLSAMEERFDLGRRMAYEEPNTTSDGFRSSSGPVSEEYSLRLTPSDQERGSSDQKATGKELGSDLDSPAPRFGTAASSLEASSTPPEEPAASIKPQELRPSLLLEPSDALLSPNMGAATRLDPARGLEETGLKATGTDDDIFARLKRELDAFDERLDAVRADVFTQGPEPLSSTAAIQSTTTASTSGPSTSSLMGSAPVLLPSLGVLSTTGGLPQDPETLLAPRPNNDTDASPPPIAHSSATGLLDSLNALRSLVDAPAGTVVTSERAPPAEPTSASSSMTTSTYSHSTSAELNRLPDPGLKPKNSEAVSPEPPSTDVEVPGVENQETSRVSLPFASQARQSLDAALGPSETSSNETEAVDSSAHGESQAVGSAREQTPSADSPQEAALGDILVAASLQDGLSAGPSSSPSGSGQSVRTTWQYLSRSLLAGPSTFRPQAMLAPLTEEVLEGFRVSEAADISGEQLSNLDGGREVRGEAVQILTVALSAGLLRKTEEISERGKSPFNPNATSFASPTASSLEKPSELSVGDLVQSQRPASLLQDPSISAALSLVKQNAIFSNEVLEAQPSQVSSLQAPFEPFAEEILQRTLSPPPQRPPSLLEAPTLSAALEALNRPTELLTFDEQLEVLAFELRRLDDRLYAASSQSISGGLQSISGGPDTGLQSISGGLGTGLQSISGGLDTGLQSLSGGLGTGLQSISGGLDTGLQGISSGLNPGFQKSNSVQSGTDGSGERLSVSVGNADERSADGNKEGGTDLDPQQSARMADIGSSKKGAVDDLDSGGAEGESEDRSVFGDELKSSAPQQQIRTEGSGESLATESETSASLKLQPAAVGRRTEVHVSSLSSVGWAAALDIDGPESLLGASADFSPWQGSEMSDPSPILDRFVRNEQRGAELSNPHGSPQTVGMGSESRPEGIGRATSSKEADEKKQGEKGNGREAPTERKGQGSVEVSDRRTAPRERATRLSIRPGESARGGHIRWPQGHVPSSRSSESRSVSAPKTGSIRAPGLQQSTGKAGQAGTKQTVTSSKASSPPKVALESSPLQSAKKHNQRARTDTSPFKTGSEVTTPSTIRSSWSSFTSLSSSPGERTEARSFEASLRRGASEDPSGQPGSKQEADRRKRARELKEKARAFDKEQREKRTRMRSPNA